MKYVIVWDYFVEFIDICLLVGDVVFSEWEFVEWFGILCMMVC